MTMQELNLSRRSIGHFDPNKDVNMELVKRVINEANFAPSSHNLQPWRLLIVSGETQKAKLSIMAYNQEKIKDAPITLVVIGDKEGYLAHNLIYEAIVDTHGAAHKDHLIKVGKRIYGKDDTSKVKFAYLNTSLFAMNLMLLFKAYGMETHPMGGFEKEAVKKAYDLKESEEVVMLLSVGYFDTTKTLEIRKNRKTFDNMTTLIK